MKRTTLIAVLTGAALLLAGCGSKSGTAAPASSAPPVSSAASSAPAAMTSAAASAASSAPAESPASSAPVESSAPDSSAPDSSAPDSSAPDSSVSDSSPSESGGLSSVVPTTTVGDSSSALDAASAKWFTTFCGGFAPVLDVAKEAQSIGASASDPAAGQKVLVDLYTKLGSAFTDTSAALKDLPPPTFSGGDAFATKVVAALGSSGPEFTKAGKTLAAIDVKKDPSGFTSALSGLGTSMTTALQPLQDLGTLKLTAATQAAFEKLPACAKLSTLG